MTTLGQPLRELSTIGARRNPTPGQGLALDETGRVPLTIPTGTPQWFPACRVYNDANISINSGAVTALTFNSERYDNNEIHSQSTNTGRLTCKVPGVYKITAHVAFESSSAGTQRQVGIRLNGTTDIARHMISVTATALDHLFSLTADYALGIPAGVNDYVEVWAFHDAGSAKNVTASGNYSPEFSMVWVAPYPA